MAEVNREEMLKALSAVQPGLAIKELVAQSTSFVFVNGNVVTYNDEVSVRHPLKDMAATIEGAVLAEGMLGILNRIKKDTVTIQQMDKEVLVKGGNYRAGLPLQTEVKLPLKEMGEVKKWYPLPPLFFKALKFVLFSTSADMSHPILTCVYIDPKRGLAEASDRYRAARFGYGATLEGLGGFLMPASSVKQVLEYDMKEVGRTSEGDGWIHFRSEEGTIFSARIYDGDFPDTDPLYTATAGVTIPFPKNIAEIVDRAVILSKKDKKGTESIEVAVSPGRMSFSTAGISGWSEELLKCPYKGAPVSFLIDPTFFQDLVELGTRKCQVAERLVKFQGEGWDHVVALKTKDDEDE